MEGMRKSRPKMRVPFRFHRTHPGTSALRRVNPSALDAAQAAVHSGKLLERELLRAQSRLRPGIDLRTIARPKIIPDRLPLLPEALSDECEKLFRVFDRRRMRR